MFIVRKHDVLNHSTDTEAVRMQRDFDVIVIGSGAGGSSFAHACAEAGRRVLLIERGSRSTTTPDDLSERATLIEKRPYDDRLISMNGTPRKLYMGGVLGGGTAVYGAAMLRPSCDDFHPGKHYSDRLERSLWDWPVDYEQLAPFYERAEMLFHLRGIQDEDYAPLNAPGPRVQSDLLPLAPISERLMESNRAKGLKPFRLPLAIDTSKCHLCDSCAGFLCPHDARRSACDLIEESVSDHKLTLMTNTEVLHLERDHRGQVDSVVVRDRETGEHNHFRSASIALAAGAISSPYLLLKSGFESPHLGRNYMFHYSPISVGIFARPTGESETFIKQVGFTDYYLGTDDCPHKMGLVQSLPAPGPLMLKKSGLKFLPNWSLNRLRAHVLPLAGIVEDLPNPENQVYLKGEDSIGVRHRFSEFDRIRGASLGKAMCGILKQAGAIFRTTQTFPSPDHVGHQCGTLRFGKDPEHAVLDENCRVFGQSNLYVVDGSFMPSSLGVGPSLTIAANAIRVAEIALMAL